MNLLPAKAQQLAGVFGCKLETLPFTYLGLPMGTTKPRVDHFGFIMNKVEKKTYSYFQFPYSCWKTSTSELSPILFANICNVHPTTPSVCT